MGNGFSKTNNSRFQSFILISRCDEIILFVKNVDKQGFTTYLLLKIKFEINNFPKSRVWGLIKNCCLY